MVRAPEPGNRRIKTLERVLSKHGLGSRADARRWIEAGRVMVNRQVARDPDLWVDLDRDEVRFDGQPLTEAPRIYLLLYKPTGVLTSRVDSKGRRTVYDLLPPEVDWLVPVGRLDLDTSGLLLLTNDTTMVERLTNPRHDVPKRYRVTASRQLSDEELERLRSGVELGDGMTRPSAVTRIHSTEGNTLFEIILREGRNRQIRRMVEALGDAVVIELVRIAIGPITIGDLEIGETRELTKKEVAMLLGGE
ncbi:MAG TPA: pseudouridine synthase [Thermoanaerobaculia bacterium]|nr:pseudouridine synthase [Thermoanaerobaculia bacterium]